MKFIWFIFYKNDLLISRNDKDDMLVPFSELSPIEKPEECAIIELPKLNEIPCRAFFVTSKDFDTKNYEFSNLRKAYKKLKTPIYKMAAKAYELLYWNYNNRYCGACGQKMHFKTPISKVCEHCGKEIWPTLAPAIIILIYKGEDEILLVQSINFKYNFFGLVAGFIETGESAEECVKREIWEETKIKVKNIHYYGSQSWPHPNNLMIGFTAEYESGEIVLQKSELCNGGWYHRDNLPTIPQIDSISRQLIDAWIDKKIY